jgi:molybdopterin-containing oxidoreductase family iron-sulfur binding subunit
MSSLIETPSFDWHRARARVAEARGPVFWRSLEELADDAGFLHWLQTQQPQLADALALDRRGFLKFMAASLALAGLSACGHPPQDQIVPYVHAPPGQVDGLPRYFATVLLRDGFAQGVLVESHMGRPTKIEGNPQHPASLGATDIFAQASVLQLWDPDRSQTVMHREDTATWNDVDAMMAALRERLQVDQGAKFRILTGAVRSPTLITQIDALLQTYPRAHWHVHVPKGEGNAAAGAILATGDPVVARLNFSAAKVILSLDADFLGDSAAGVRYARDYADRRFAEGDTAAASRLYVIESTPSMTGCMADHRLALESRGIEAFARALARRLGVASGNESVTATLHSRWLDALAEDLHANRGASLVVVGEAQPAWLHALGHVLNHALENVGTTIEYADPVDRSRMGLGAGNLADLAKALRVDAVDTLLVLDSNPAYDAPGDLNFAQALRQAPHVVHLGLYRDETGMSAEWHLPMAHQLEAWSDARAYDGTASIAQPLLAPLYSGRSAYEVLAALSGDEVREGRALVKRRWREHLPDDAAWSAALQSGLIANTRSGPRPVSVNTEFLDGPASAARAAAPESEAALELLFRPDPTIGDGSWSNNGWLQELPKPLTQLTWENAALISPALAEQRHLSNGDVVELRIGERAVLAPIWIMPGQALHSVTIHLGYGRRASGRVGNHIGFDAYTMRTASAVWCAQGLTLRKTGSHIDLAGTQHHFNMEGRDLVRVQTLARYLQTRGSAANSAEDRAAPSLYPDYPPGEYAWGMSIDLNACIGCKACTIACQAENNIPVVGKDQVLRGREMHWIRVDRYYEGSPDNPLAYSQPVPCMMCEHAPCELVCPVGATVHDNEGLNLQVYNRCVGTRFCSNNCPYKVRRFNFLQYQDDTTEALAAQRNPEVTVRRRGVMEKCTYCVQRIETAHIEADKANRRIQDGEVLTACQAVCPTRAIRFGDISDPKSQVAQAKRSARNYTLLQEFNTRPRTSYLARLRNPHPGLRDPP